MEFASAENPPDISKNQDQLGENGLPSSFPAVDRENVSEDTPSVMKSLRSQVSSVEGASVEGASVEGASVEGASVEGASVEEEDVEEEDVASALPPVDELSTPSPSVSPEEAPNLPVDSQDEPDSGSGLADNSPDDTSTVSEAVEPGSVAINSEDMPTANSPSPGPEQDIPATDVPSPDSLLPIGEPEPPGANDLDVQPLKPTSSLLSLDAAQLQTSPAFQFQGEVGNGDASVNANADVNVNANDLFQFTLTQSGVFTANLTGLTGDADVQLIQDKNANGSVDLGEILAWQWERGTASESIRSFLGAGDYVVRVASYNQANANYQLETTFSQANQDERAFSIELTPRSGLDVLSDAAMAAIQRASDFWENVISHSSLATSQTLFINLFGTQDDAEFLAYAGPQSYQITTDGRQLPRRGSAVINTSYADLYNGDPDYLESVMRHEFGHVLGLGVAWDSRGNDLVNLDNQTYRDSTYAAYAYGELLGEFRGVEIPLDSAFAHWQEGALDTELMTPRAEPQGVSMPLSQVTIASLRDLGWNVNHGAAEDFTLPTTLA